MAEIEEELSVNIDASNFRFINQCGNDQQLVISRMGLTCLQALAIS